MCLFADMAVPASLKGRDPAFGARVKATKQAQEKGGGSRRCSRSLSPPAVCPPAKKAASRTSRGGLRAGATVGTPGPLTQRHSFKAAKLEERGRARNELLLDSQQSQQEHRSVQLRLLRRQTQLLNYRGTGARSAPAAQGAAVRG